MSEQPAYVTRHEMAAILRVSVATLDRWQASDNPPPSVTWGLRRRLYEPSRVVAWAKLRQAHDQHDKAA